MRPGSFAAAVRHSASISQQNPLEVKLDGGFWRCTADERIAFGWRVQRLWGVGEFTSDQATFAVVAYARSARPTHRNGAGFRQLEQAAEAGVPWDSETASQERHDRPAARRTVRTMRQSCGHTGDAWRESGRGPEQFDVDPRPGNAPCRQAFLEIFEEAGRTTQVEIGVLGNAELVEQLGCEMAWSIEVLAEPVAWCRPTVNYTAMGRRERNEQIVRFLGKRMVRPIAG